MHFTYRLKGKEMGFSNILETILINRGITNIKEFLNPNKQHLEDILLYDNIQRAYECIKKHRDCGSQIVILVDCDADGYTSAAMIYQYLQIIIPSKNLNYIIHDDKKHGLDRDTMVKLNYMNCNLLIIPDASSNDYVEHYKLKQKGIDIVVLDHHECDRYSFSAIVVNNQLSKRVTNKSMTGVGVTYKLCKYADSQLGLNKADDFLDLLAVGMIGDVCDLKNLESRYLVHQGLEQISKGKNKNDFITTLIKAKSYELKDNINIVGIGFYIVPLINAIIRNGTYEQKEIMFKAFLNVEETYTDNIRGKGEVELSISEYALRIAEKCKRQQKKLTDEGVEKAKQQILDYKLNEHGIIVINSTELVERNYTGLIANKIASLYQKPCILLSNHKEEYSGSGRGYEKKDIKDLRKWCRDSKLFTLAEGHANACGLSLHKSNIDKLYENTQMLKTSDKLIYDVDGIFNEKTISKTLIESISKYKNIWGTTVHEPLFAIENVTISTVYVELMGTKGNTIKINYNGISFILYHTNEKKFESIKQHSAICMTVIGKFSSNEYKGNSIPQIIVEDMSFTPCEVKFRF